MATTIAATNFTDGQDKRITLSNSQIARVIDIGTDWTTLRVGFRLAMTDAGASITDFPRMWFGLLASPSAGMANGPLGNTTSHFLGWVTNAATFLRVAGPPVYYTVTLARAKRVGSTNTLNNATVVIFPAALTATRGALVLQITKGSPNFTIAGVAYSSAGTGDITLAQLISGMEVSTLAGVETTLELSGQAYVQVTSGTTAVDEATDGFLNSICVAWDRSSGIPYFSEMLWAKMA